MSFFYKENANPQVTLPPDISAHLRPEPVPLATASGGPNLVPPDSTALASFGDTR